MSEFDPKLQSEQTQPTPRPSRRSALLLWAIAGGGLALVNLLAMLFPGALARIDPQHWSLICNLAYYLLFAALPVFLLARQRDGLWRAYRPYPLPVFSMLSIVALALLGVFFFIDLSALWSILLEALGLRFASAELAIGSGARGLTAAVLLIAVLPAVCEEFLFRGAILSGLESGGAKRAVLASALMFALLHGSLAGLPMQFLVGLILGWLVVWSDSIYAGLIYHTTHNAATVILQFVVDRELPATAPAEAERMIDAVSGASGMLRLLVELLMLGLMMLFTLRMFRMTARLRGVEIAPPRPTEPLRGSEWALLLLGLIFAGLLYGADLYFALPGGAA